VIYDNVLQEDAKMKASRGFFPQSEAFFVPREIRLRSERQSNEIVMTTDYGKEKNNGTEK
jgi:hypothetical protein